MGLPRSTLRWALVHVRSCRRIHLYGESKKIDSRPPNSSPGTHAPEPDHQIVTRGRPQRWCFGVARPAAAVGAGPKAPVKQPTAAHCSSLFLPPHSPSDMGLPRSTLRWALVHVRACRKIHLYGESKKSTHGHQTHPPARTHQSQLVSVLLPPPRPPNAESPPHGSKRSRVSILVQHTQTSPLTGAAPANPTMPRAISGALFRVV